MSIVVFFGVYLKSKREKETFKNIAAKCLSLKKVASLDFPTFFRFLVSIAISIFRRLTE